jgi:hypothetical protein
MRRALAWPDSEQHDVSTTARFYVGLSLVHRSKILDIW